MAKTIMIVDDEKDVRDSVETILKKEKYKVVKAVDGDDALKKLDKSKTDLILLDIMMPGTPAKEVLKKIKKTKVILFSVVRTSEAEREHLKSGGNVVDFIQKPFDITDMLNRIKKALK